MTRYSGSIEEEGSKHSGEKVEKKTIIFEEKYDVDINDFSTTKEVDEYLEYKFGRKLKIIKPETKGIVSDRNIFELKEYDINRLFDATIKKSAKEIFYSIKRYFGF